MPFTKVDAPQIELVQNVLDGDVIVPAFSRRSYLNGGNSSLLSLAPPLTLVANLLTVAAPVRNNTVVDFAGIGLSVQTTVAAANFPTVATRDVQVKNVASTTHTWTYPVNRRLGQLMVVVIATAAITTITTPTGWTLVASQAGTASRTSVYERIIDGLEPVDLTVTFGTASGAVMRSWCIDLADAGSEVVSGLNDSAAGTSLDLATISPTWSTTEATNTLYLAVVGTDNDVAFGGFPAGYTVTGQDTSPSATANIDCALAYAERSVFATLENPGAFTYAAARSTGHVIAIKPKVTARINWDGVRVDKAGSAVATRRVINIIDGAGISTTVVDNPTTQAVDITITATGGAAADWATVLGIGHTSGANNAHIETGQILSFGVEGSIPPTGQIRSSTDLTIRAVGTFEVISTATMQMQTLGNIPFKVVTNAVERLEIQGDGAWQIQGATGTSGQFLTSAGSTSTPVWATFALTMLPSQAADTFLGRLAGAGTPTAQLLTDVDSTSIIYDVTSHTFQLAAASGGDITRSQNSVTYTIGTNAVTNAKAAQMAANTIKANATAALANAADLAISADSFPARVGGNLVSHPFATLFGTYLSYSAGVADWIGLDVRVNTGALVGTRHRINVIGTSPISVAAADDGANDEVDITISIASIPLTSLTTVAALSVIANAVNSVATPTAVASSADDTVFRRTGATLNWGQLTVGMAPNDVWTYAKIQNVSATSRFLGRITAAAGDIEELTGTQATTLLDSFAGSVKGLVPVSAGGTVNFLRADGVFAVPPGVAPGAGTLTPAMDVARVEITEAGTGPFNDYATGNLNNADLLIITSTNNQTYTGFTAPSQDGRKFRLLVGAGLRVTIPHLSASSVAANRVACPGSATLIVEERTMLEFDYVNSTWRVAVVSSQLPTFESDIDISIATTVGGLWLSAGHTPVASPSVSNADVLINATSGVGIKAGAAATTAVTADQVRLDADGDITLNASSGVAIVAGSGATGFPVTAVTTGNLELLADAAVNLTAESGNVAVSAGGSVNISAGVGVFIPSPLETGDMSNTGALSWTNVISPAALAAQTNNYNPTGFSTCTTLRITLTGAQNLTGLLGIANKVVQIVNADTADNLTLIHDNGAAPATSSTTTNRFLLAGNTNRVLLPQAMVKLWYDNTSTRWRADYLI